MSGPLTIRRFGEDHYGRTLAMVAGSEGDLSSWQLRHDQAIYKADWDDGLNVARTCLGDVLWGGGLRPVLPNVGGRGTSLLLSAGPRSRLSRQDQVQPFRPPCSASSLGASLI
jgi:hypothetical protein